MKNKRRLLLFIMFLLLPITLNYFSPYLIIDGLVNKIISGSFIVWGLMFLSSLVFGRAFCSYVCPYGGLQMVIDRSIEKPLKEFKRLRVLKYVLGTAWLIFILFFTITGFGDLKINIFYLTENVISVDEFLKVIGYYVIVVGISIFPLILGKRATCHYFCPMSILNIIGTKLSTALKLPALRLEANPDKCIRCNRCSKECPMSINVMDKVKSGIVNNVDCILCGECVKACNKKVINRGFRRYIACQGQLKHQRIEEKNL